MQPDLERPDALVGQTGQVEGKAPPVGAVENDPDAPETNFTLVRCAASPPLADIAARINEAHGRASAAIEAAVDAGRLLIQAKDQVGHGGWLRWLKANTNVSERTAQAYMKVARDLPKSAVTAELTLDGALKLLASPKADPKRPAAPRSAASPKSAKVEVLPPEPKPPGLSPNLMLAENLVDRIRGDIEAAERRKIDITNMVLGLLGFDEQISVPPLRMPADPRTGIDHPSLPAVDGINTINDTGNAGAADDTNELDVHFGPLTGREWIALSKCFDIHDPHDCKPGEPQYRPEFLRLVEHFHVPLARLIDRIMDGNAMEPCLLREDDTDLVEGVE